MPSSRGPSAVVEAEGHLIDSQLLTAILRHRDQSRAPRSRSQAFDIGKTNDDFSRLTLKVSAPDQAALAALLEALMPLGCHAAAEQDALLRDADRDGCAPEDFYSTTNQRTQVRVGGRWIAVERQRMDAAIVRRGGRGASCRKLRDIRRGRSGRLRPRRAFGYAGVPRSRTCRLRVHGQ
jgi:hypothetical protein